MRPKTPPPLDEETLIRFERWLKATLRSAIPGTMNVGDVAEKELAAARRDLLRLLVDDGDGRR